MLQCGSVSSCSFVLDLWGSPPEGSHVGHSSTVNIASFEEGLGRIMFVARALEHDRPFLRPLYKYI